MATKKNPKEEEQGRVAPVLTEEDTEFKAAETPSVPEQLIYIGPTIRKNGIGLRTNQVFLGGRPAHLKDLYTEYPHIKALFVPVDKLQESLKQINQAGTALNTALLSLKGV
ncbi:hypothetical protein [Paenibacillus sp. FSL R5-0810]|uniref:hypothetical protein n=1 Tax=Paenibacillus sp. FSL R5-0810 TaxID=2921659 RepID=UPI0030F4D5C1